MTSEEAATSGTLPERKASFDRIQMHVYFLLVLLRAVGSFLAALREAPSLVVLQGCLFLWGDHQEGVFPRDI